MSADARIDFHAASPAALRALMAAEQASHQLGLEPTLVDLVKLRASQINGCAFCVDLHSRDLHQRGESERRIWAVSVWNETPFFTPRERAALRWTEALTLLPRTGAPDADYTALQAQFSDKEMVDLTLAIGLINTWNRLAVGFRKMPR